MIEGNGYIKLWRRFLEWEWYDDINCKAVFIHCLLKANYKDKSWRGKIINRGQFFTSIDILAKELHLTTKQIRMSLSKLELTGEIIKKGASEGTYIIVCNYDNYQHIDEAEGQTNGERRASEGQAEGEQRATTNKDKKVKKERKKRSITEFVAPTIEEVKEYFDLNGYTEQSAIKAYNYYHEGKWIDSRGNKVLNWKQKMQSVWFKPENEKSVLKLSI
jgi:hypothetical protein